MVNQEWAGGVREKKERGEGERVGDWDGGKCFRWLNGNGLYCVRPRGGDGVEGDDVPLRQLGRRAR
jgi:hypothetical protein